MTDAAYPLTWDLTPLAPAPATPEFAARLAAYRAGLESLAERSAGLPAVSAAGAGVWGGFLGDLAGTAAEGTDLRAFVECHAAADAGEPLYQRLEAALSALDPLRSAIAARVEYAVQAAPEAEFTAFLAADPAVKDAAFFLEDARRLSALRLPEAQELLAAELDVDGLSAWGRLYDRLSGAMRITVMERGELVEKSPGQVTFDSPERSVRQNNFYAADKAWAGLADTAADCLNHIAGVRLTRYRRLGLADHLESPLLHNRMQRETLMAMLSAVADRRPMLVRYLGAKAKRLGVEKPAWYDLSAPLPALPNPEAGQPAGAGEAATLSYDAACRTVVRTLGEFSPDFGDFAEMSLRERWVEAENRPGKRQGGFCTDFPAAGVGRIFMTYTDSADSMSTLAHELGHLYHSHVLREEPFFLRDYPMNLAETASTFAEQVLGAERLRAEPTDTGRLAVLDHQLSDAVAFCMNLPCRFLFEDRFHRERAAGEVPADRLCDLMREAQRECYGGALAEGEENPRFWVSKLHFYITGLPFYNFPYTFGYLLSLGLYAAATAGDSTGGDDFPARYRAFLRATGRMTAEEAVQSSFGHNLSGPDFWHGCLDVIERRVGEFVELAG